MGKVKILNELGIFKSGFHESLLLEVRILSLIEYQVYRHIH
jgi:hypothetical protein